MEDETTPLVEASEASAESGASEKQRRTAARWFGAMLCFSNAELERICSNSIFF